MRKTIALFFAFMFLTSFSFAEGIDLSALSYDELVELVDKAQRQIMFSDYWQEVEVPSGSYEIGKDIPEGEWTITASETHRPNIHLSVLDERDWVKSNIPVYTEIKYQGLVGIKHPAYSDGSMSFVTWKLENGQYFSVSEGTVIFTPYKGLGFKFKK